MQSPESDPAAPFAHRILLVRGHRVLLDADVAALYEVEPRRLQEAVARNRQRFPQEFLLELSREEVAVLRPPVVIGKEGGRGRRAGRYAFTGQGMAMLASLLRSQRAIEVHLALVRTFVQERPLPTTHPSEPAPLQAVFALLRQLRAVPTIEPKRRAGFFPARTGPLPAE